MEEELVVKRLDYERAKIQWERRTVRAPASGVVLRLHKDVGEFIGPSDPQLLTIVQLNPLLAVFAVPSRAARLLRAEQDVVVCFPEAGGGNFKGTVHFVSPVVDGKSGTMRVEVLLDNADGKLYSGDPCSLLIDGLEGDEGTPAPSLTSAALNHPQPSPRPAALEGC
jgi:multidrug efflux pump subunit AcrA (membrane-fusion protein)